MEGHLDRLGELQDGPTNAAPPRTPGGDDLLKQVEATHACQTSLGVRFANAQGQAAHEVLILAGEVGGAGHG